MYSHLWKERWPLSNDQSKRVARVNRGDPSSKATRALRTKGSEVEEDWM